jgi:hypothetical protein
MGKLNSYYRVMEYITLLSNTIDVWYIPTGTVLI